MPNRAQAVTRVSFWILSLASLGACSAAPAAAPQAPPSSVAAAGGSSAGGASASPAPSTAPATAAEPAPENTAPRESPGFAETLAALRPARALDALQALQSAPADDREAYARAALAYAPTDVPAMTLLWGMTYQAMGGGSSDGALASALARVLTERVTAAAGEADRQVSFKVRLAPGQMPVRVEATGAAEAPLAHVFESLFSPAVTGFRPPWTVEQFYDVLSNWAGLIATHGTPLDEKVELNAWLLTLAKSGHLEAYCYQLLGSAFPAELKLYRAQNAAALKAYRDYLGLAPLRPKRAILPDELIRIR